MTVLFSSPQVLVPSFATASSHCISWIFQVSWEVSSHIFLLLMLHMQIEMSGDSSDGWSLLSLGDWILYGLNFIFYNRLLLLTSSNPAWCRLLSPSWPDPILWDSWPCPQWPHAFLPLFLLGAWFVGVFHLQSSFSGLLPSKLSLMRPFSQLKMFLPSTSPLVLLPLFCSSFWSSSMCFIRL